MSHVPRPASPIVRALIIAAVILLVAGALAWLSPHYISDELSRRLLGAALGLVAAIYANEIPKALTPLARLRCDAATEQSLRRFTGWSLTLGGVMYGLAWLFTPIGMASTIAIVLLAASLVLAFLRQAWVIGIKTKG